MTKADKAAVLMIVTAFAKHREFLIEHLGKPTDLQNVVAAAKLRVQVLEAIQIKLEAK